MTGQEINIHTGEELDEVELHTYTLDEELERYQTLRNVFPEAHWVNRVTLSIRSTMNPGVQGHDDMM